ncbi:aminotransferase class III-fold pyridoxal phosphate-dependent enzyme [Candidatus Peregrinibacteria bacterium]|nr:aminotransferase class III-fold pyridoxal phosphate-dependent enzyme [Candidatus Peregrinibacteria bacterium]
MAESLRAFLDRDPPFDEVAGMRDRNSIPAWDKPHPHGLQVTSGDGAVLMGKMKNADGQVVDVKLDDCHGMIVSNGLGYNNPEIEDARAMVRQKRGLDIVSSNFTSPVIEWAREQILQTLGPDYVLWFVGVGGEANDVGQRVAYAKGHGHAELICLRNGYSGSTVASNAVCGQKAWVGNSTPSLPGVHLIDPTVEDLEKLLSVLPNDRFISLRTEAGRTGVGGFTEIPDAFLRKGAELVRARGLGMNHLDEVQTGMGRTGRAFWASQDIFKGMQGPDVITMAKSLGAGHRAAAIAIRRDHLDALKGSLSYHTFGGMEEDAAAMGTAVNIVRRDNLVENAKARGEQFQKEFSAAKGTIPFPVEVDGVGLMQALALPTANKVAAVLKVAPQKYGWIPGKGGFKGERLRLAPPLNVDAAFISRVVQKAVETLRDPEVEAA